MHKTWVEKNHNRVAKGLIDEDDRQGRCSGSERAGVSVRSTMRYAIS